MPTKEQIQYKGTPITELSKEELIEALCDMNRLYLNERESFHKMAELAQLKYRPQTWLGGLLNL